MVLLLPLLIACKTRGIESIPGPNADVSITIVNPTTCSDCDPLDNVNALRLDVIRPETGEVLATTSVPWPGEPPSLPELGGFGVVRVELTGLNGGRTLSVGRTPPFVVEPGQPTELTMLFLPVNEPIALTTEMTLERSRHSAYTRLDGRVVLIGGLDPSGGLRYDSTEIFDPISHTFGLDSAAPIIPVGPALVEEEDGDLLLVGGASTSGSRLANVWAYTVDGEGEQGALDAQGDLPEPRSGGCAGLVGPQKGAVMGGVDAVDGATTIDVMRFGTTAWEFEAAGVQGFDNRDVRGCIGLPGGADEEEGRIFVLGADATSTGFFSYPAEGSVGFSAVGNGGGDQFVSSSTLVSREAREDADHGWVWIVGGVTSDGRVQSETWNFDTSTGNFNPGPELATARAHADVGAWIEPDVEAVGCGWADSGETEGAGSAELVDATGSLLEVPLDRERPGCTMSVLSDGALLIAGGFGYNDAGQVGAVVIVPSY